MGHIRSNCTNNRLFERAFFIVAEITIPKPHTAGRHIHRANAAAKTVEEHFRINMFDTFANHVISHLRTRTTEQIAISQIFLNKKS